MKLESLNMNLQPLVFCFLSPDFCLLSTAIRNWINESKYSTSVEKSLQIHPFFAKQTQFFPIFQLKTMISQKNKPKTKPIQTQYKPNVQEAKK